MYPYAYLVWCLIFGLVWVFLYWVRKDTRREMLLMSLLCIPLGPVAAYFNVKDYWHPETFMHTAVGVEDVLIAFFIGGISAVLYEFLYAKPRERTERPGFWWLIVLPDLGGAVFMYVSTLFGIASITATFMLFILFAAIPIILRPWLFRNSVLSGVAFMTFLFFFYKLFFWMYPGIVDVWWFGASGVRVLGVPVEEMAWAFLWGMVAGPGSELVARLKLPKYIRTL